MPNALTGEMPEIFRPVGRSARSAFSEEFFNSSCETGNMNNVLLTGLLAFGLLGQQPPASAPWSMDLSQFKPYGYNKGEGNYVIAPMYTNAPELTAQDSVPKGKVYEFTVKSTDSPLFPGIAKNKPGEVVPYERRCWVYVPAQYQPGKPAPATWSPTMPWAAASCRPS